MTAEQPQMPEWARRERQGDLFWIQQNLDVFQLAASIAYAEVGRGAIVVDTTVPPVEELGHPFGYFSVAQLEGYDDEDTLRMVHSYNPRKELVVVLLKSDDRISSYRIRPQW